MAEADVRGRFAAARRAFLATADPDGRPHLVPVTFDLRRDTLVTAVDHKPKSTTALRRLRNIARNPRVSLLTDEYRDADWDRLWWARVDGLARVLTGAEERAAALPGLVAKYPQYRDRPPGGPVIVVAVQAWRGWSGAG